MWLNSVACVDESGLVIRALYRSGRTIASIVEAVLSYYWGKGAIYLMAGTLHLLVAGASYM